jgi:hypothetical protein
VFVGRVCGRREVVKMGKCGGGCGVEWRYVDEWWWVFAGGGADDGATDQRHNSLNNDAGSK